MARMAQILHPDADDHAKMIQHLITRIKELKEGGKAKRDQIEQRGATPSEVDSFYRMINEVEYYVHHFDDPARPRHYRDYAFLASKLTGVSERLGKLIAWIQRENPGVERGYPLYERVVQLQHNVLLSTIYALNRARRAKALRGITSKMYEVVTENLRAGSQKEVAAIESKLAVLGDAMALFLLYDLSNLHLKERKEAEVLLPERVTKNYPAFVTTEPFRGCLRSLAEIIYDNPMIKDYLESVPRPPGGKRLVLYSKIHHNVFIGEMFNLVNHPLEEALSSREGFDFVKGIFGKDGIRKRTGC